MDVAAKQKLLLKKLKQQIKVLQKKEEQSRLKMQAALREISKLGQAYKVRLASKVRDMEQKLAHTEVACYVKLAVELENQLAKGIKKKVRALAAATKSSKRRK